MDNKIRNQLERIEALEQTLKDYDYLFRSSEVPTLIIDTDGTYLDFNDAYIKLVGRRQRSELEKHHPAKVSPPQQPDGKDSLESANEHIANALKNGHDRFEWAHLTPEGDEFISDVSLDLIQFQNRECIRAIIRDISKRIELEKLVEERTKELEDAKNVAEKLASIDPMTGLFNRRHFSDISQQVLKLAKRYQHHLSALMIDIDKFKRINDTYGHATGDKVIIMVANRLKEYVRDSDIIARYGGEEFMMLLPKTSKDNAGLLAEKIRETIEHTDVISEDHHSLNATVSIGVSETDLVSDTSIEDVIRRADDNLYRAKKTGRNKVIS